MVRQVCIKHLRRKLTDFTLQSTVVISIAVGVLPFKYNIAKRRLEKSRLATCYTIAINVLVLIIVVAMYKTKTNVSEIDFLNKKPLNAVLTFLHAGLSVLMLLMTFYRNWTTRDQLLSTFQEIGALDQEQTGTRGHKCVIFQHYVLWKGVGTFLQLFSYVHSMYEILTIYERLSLWLMAVFFGSFQLIFFAVWNQFFLAVLLIYRNLWALNSQLKANLHKMSVLSSRRGECDDSYPPNMSNQIREEVDGLISIYVRLVRVCEQLTALYKYQLLFLFGTYISVDIMNVFYLLVIYRHKVVGLSPVSLLLFTEGLMINLLDFWVGISTCELTLNTSEETSLILRSFSGLPHVDSNLQDSLNFFGLLCCCNKFRFNLCGLFDVHHRSGFMMLVTTIVYLVCLVQFDFMNL